MKDFLSIRNFTENSVY